MLLILASFLALSANVCYHINSGFFKTFFNITNFPNFPSIFPIKEQTFKLDESQIKFLDLCQKYGFKDASELVIMAIQRLEIALETEQLKESAMLYAEVYAEDTELQELAELGLEEWLKL
ncbi:hypothetical protein [Microcoleus sp. B4-D4]|uniref:hypothetical protein n=1 Tax=Microcoleus sp. B4-D4 TaxID=2818667 RepID=UPI002FD60630